MPKMSESAIPLMPTKIGNLPLTSGGGRTATSGTMSRPATGSGTLREPYGGWSKRKAPEGDLTFSASGRVKVEEEKTVIVSDAPHAAAATTTDEGKKGGYKSGYAWVVWIFVIFIIIAIIILAIFWWCKPDWAMNTCPKTGGKSLNCYCAGAYAFGVALFLVVILVLAWCCCTSSGGEK